MTDPWPDKISWVTNPGARQSEQIKADTSQFSCAATSHVRNFHRTLPSFQPTPLAKLDNLARHLGVASIRVKDESHRCGLNAFKILGASFALCTHLAQKLSLSPENLSFNEFQSPELKQRAKDITCIAATDGNHGKAVAWAAKQLGCRAQHPPVWKVLEIWGPMPVSLMGIMMMRFNWPPTAPGVTTGC